MSAMQRNFVPNQQINQQQQQQQPVQRQPRYRFRWPIYVGIPAVVITFLWFVGGLEIVFAFANIMGFLGVALTNRYVLLACLGITSVTILLIVKVFRKNN